MLAAVKLADMFLPGWESPIISQPNHTLSTPQSDIFLVFNNVKLNLRAQL